MNNRYDCARVQEELGALADDAIPEEAATHLAGCDDCRDLLHDARLTAHSLRHSLGADFAPMDPEVLTARLLAAIDARPATSPPNPLSMNGEGEGKAKPEAAPTPPTPSPFPSPPPSPSPSRSPSPFRERGLGGEVVARRRIGASILGAGLFAAAASVAVAVVALRGPAEAPPDGPDAPRVIPSGPVGPWHATLGRVLGAGLTVKADGAANFAAVPERSLVAVGSTIRTDARTRARLDLDDGTVLVLDRGTTVVLDPSSPRHARIVEGNLVADVAHRADAPPAVITTAQGDVRVLGTKFALSASREHTTVHVTRGVVRLGEARADGVEVKTGQEAVLARGRVTVSPAVDLGGRVAWSELGPDEATTSSGLGELRARRPGSSVERDEAVHLAEHSVRVRVVGNVARTEIEEVFRNDTGRELEGLYRFPLPPEAQVEELALDVDGRMESGAFVDRDRAAAIWRGVIHHAAPNTPPPREEYVWVPGPWRDPALLEWQRGGRFELRVFPIPARGSRRVRIAYTQTIAPSGGGVRRYVYPLPHDPAGSTRVDHMTMDVQVLGHRGARPARMLGYPFTAADTSAAASRWTFSQDAFTPSGDVVLEYALGDQDVPVTAWGYAEPTNTEGAYVALALRPQLPRWGEGRPRDYVFVVDASRSMVGERYTRATRLLTSIVGEMDRRDRLTVLACDVRCVAMRESMAPASADVARQVGAWLQAREPAGGSDLGAALRASVSAAGATPDDRDVRVVYLGDGASTVGHRRPSTLALEVTTALPPRRATFTAVAVGAEADTTTLSAMARAGGGVVVPYLPGESRPGAALAVLEATYGAVLRDPEVSLPSGLVAMAPARPDNLRSGSEAVITARMLPGVREVDGEVVLRGTVAGEAFEARYPITVRATEDAGNAFVPRLFGAARIADLDASGAPGARAEMVALSQRFHLASRYTSLLVLESPAMFRAFGVTRTEGGVTWTGESEALATGAAAAPDARAELEANADEGALLGDMAANRGAESPVEESPARDLAAAASEPMGTLHGRSGGGSGAGFGQGLRQPTATTARPMSAPAPVAPAAPMRIDALADVNEGPVSEADRMNTAARERRAAVVNPWAGGRWMRRTWVRRAAVSAGGTTTDSLRARTETARQALAANPDSRDRHRELFRWLSVAGELDEAARVAERWITRDPLDADALMRLADVAARRGDRLRAMRWLGGVADVRPDDVLLLDRLAMMHARAGDAETACAYRVAAAESRSSDAAKVAEAVRCERANGREAFAARMLDLVTDGGQRARAEALALGGGNDPLGSVRGEMVASATWDGGADLDLVLIDPNGVRISWQGGRAGTAVSNPLGRGEESLGLSRLTTTGEWRLEVVRTGKQVAGLADDDDDGRDAAVRGSVTLTALGERRVLPFTLTGSRALIGRVVVTREEQLVPTSGTPPPGAQLEMRRW
jgi:Flp pilus assembly protein TadD